jgi:hypothetical protein
VPLRRDVDRGGRDHRHPQDRTNAPYSRHHSQIHWAATSSTTESIRRIAMDWPTAAVIIAIVIAVMVIASTYIAGRYSK